MNEQFAFMENDRRDIYEISSEKVLFSPDPNSFSWVVEVVVVESWHSHLNSTRRYYRAS